MAKNWVSKKPYIWEADEDSMTAALERARPGLD